MKKGTSAILLVLYLAFSTGVVINLHFCMNNFDSFQFGASKSETCGKCGMHTTDSNGCCNDEIKIIKIDDDQQVAGISFKFVGPEVVIPPVSNFNEELIIDSFRSSSFISYSPPLSRQDTYLQNCVFRI